MATSCCHFEFLRQAVAEIPWGHNLLILNKIPVENWQADTERDSSRTTSRLRKGDCRYAVATIGLAVLVFCLLSTDVTQLLSPTSHPCILSVTLQHLLFSSSPLNNADFLAGLAILSGLVYNPQTIRATVSKEYLMDLIRESSFAQYLAENAREEGMKQGIEQGGRECAIEDLIDVLEIRFALAASDPLAARIGAIDDVQRLKQLFRAAIQVPSLEAFRLLLDADE